MQYRSIFTSATRRERIANFEAYWAYSLGHDGEILQAEKDLAKKRDRLAASVRIPFARAAPWPTPRASIAITWSCGTIPGPSTARRCC